MTALRLLGHLALLLQTVGRAARSLSDFDAVSSFAVVTSDETVTYPPMVCVDLRADGTCGRSEYVADYCNLNQYMWNSARAARPCLDPTKDTHTRGAHETHTRNTYTLAQLGWHGTAAPRGSRPPPHVQPSSSHHEIETQCEARSCDRALTPWLAQSASR